MAVFNGEKYIKEQLDSIIGQTVKPDEIVICDDSGNNETFKAIEPFIERYPGLIQYHKNDSSLGASKNFEKAISLTNGDLIFLSDQDDVWNKTKIGKLASLLNDSPDCGGAFCNSEVVDQELNPLGYTHWDLRGFSADQPESEHRNHLDFFVRRVPAAGHNIAFKCRLKDLVLPFPELEECHDTWLGLIIEATEGWCFTAECLTKFRQHDSNLSKAGKFNQLQQALYAIRQNRFSWNEQLYSELIERLSSSGRDIDKGIFDLLRNRRDHCRIRAEMNCNIFKRFPMICKEIGNRRYFKYGRGWKSVCQDLVLRLFSH